MTDRSLRHGAWAVAAAGALGCALGWRVAPADLPHAWLAALVCWIGWPLGSMALVLIHALTGGAWGWAIRRQLASGIATLPLMVPGVVPLFLMRRSLFPWMAPQVDALLSNRFYLNPPFFYVRAAMYLAVWLGLGFLVLRTLRRDDAQGALYRMAPPALIALGLTITFASIDYTLSMEPQFKSSIYGMLAATECVLFSLSVAVMMRAFGAAAADLATTRDLGKLLFALLVLWAYLDFMQLLIVWNSDLPDEAGWYLERLRGGWGFIAALTAVLHFALPFFALIWAPVQRSRRAIGWMGALLVLIEVPRAWWVVIPAAGRPLSLVDAAAMLAVLGAASAMALGAWHGVSIGRTAVAADA